MNENELLVLGCGNQGGVACRFRAGARGSGASRLRPPPDTRRVPVRRARCAAGAYPLGMQRRPSQRGARAGVSSGRGRRIAVRRQGDAGAVGPGDGPRRIHQWRPAVRFAAGDTVVVSLG